MNWRDNAFIALLLTACIAAHSVWKQRKLVIAIQKLREQLSYYEWDDGSRKWRCAKCGIQPENGRICKYGVIWCMDCCPKEG